MPDQQIKNAALLLTEKQAETLVSYADGDYRVLRERPDLDMASLKDAALMSDIEKCPDCGWWAESYELLDDDGDVDGHCMNCRPSEAQLEDRALSKAHGGEG